LRKLPDSTRESLTNAAASAQRAAEATDPQAQARHMLDALSLINSAFGSALGVSDDLNAQNGTFLAYYRDMERFVQVATGLEHTLPLFLEEETA
jgi:hypothetical protein